MSELPSQHVLSAREQARLRIYLLGGFQVNVGGRLIADSQWRLRKSRSIVKLLALAPQHRLHRDQLLEALWPDLPPADGAHNLHQVLYIARRALEPAGSHSSFLQFEDEVLSLGAEPSFWIDANAFELVAQGARRAREIPAYRDALALYRGDLLPDDRYEDWAAARREKLHQLRLTLLVEVAELYERDHNLAAAMESATLALDGDPLHEGAHRMLMRIYAQTGRRPQALRQYQLLREALERELSTDPEAESTVLYQQILAADLQSESPPSPIAPPTVSTALPATRHDHPPQTAQPPVRNNLPLALDSFIGREGAIADLKRLLGRSRLVTLTGSGGCGKTRLAVQVADVLCKDDALRAVVADRLYTEGIMLVEFTALSDPALVVHVVADTLDVREQPGQALLSTLADYLRDKRMLLLFDNCEHIVAACARVAESLLQNSAHLRILATSREPLRIAGEANYRVPSLSTPPIYQPLEGLSTQVLPAGDQDLMRYEAVCLFVERAVAARADFELSPSDATTVAKICALLDGMPLAIELAAVRVTSMSLEQIAAPLDDCFRFLTAGRRTAMPRHQTLYAVIDWSYGLLTLPERELLRRLSVFAGGWTLEAAADVCFESDAYEVLALLSQLVDKSLVLVDDYTATVRYSMLNTIRQFAREKLLQSGESEPVRSRHLQFALELAETAEEKLHGAEHRTWFQRLRGEYDNLWLALDWSMQSGNGESGLRLAGALWYFWLLRGYWREGRERLETLLAAAAEHGAAESEAASLDSSARIQHATIRAKALNAAGLLARVQGDLGAARSHYEASLVIAAEIGDRRNRAWALLGLEAIDELEGNHATARPLLEEGLRLLRELGDRWEIAWSLGSVGGVALLRNDYLTAGPLFVESLTIRRELGDAWGVAWSLQSLGYVSLYQQDYRQAQLYFEESLDLFESLRSKRGIAGCLSGWGRGCCRSPEL